MSKDAQARAAWEHIARLFLSDEMHTRFHDAVASLGLPHPGALKLLLVLDPDDPPPMRDIASVLQCDASYVTFLVDALEQPGYVERRPAPADRRVKLVGLTGEGLAARQQAFDIISEPPAGFTRLTATEARELARLLGKACSP